jgi:hypothetical protein
LTAVARTRRRGRARNWLTAAAVVVVIGGGFGALAHNISGRTAGSETSTAGAAGAADSATEASGGPGAGGTPRVSSGANLSAGGTANPAAARGTLLQPSFADDAKVFVAAQARVRPSPASGQPLAGSGSTRCATVARGEASSTAGYQAGGGNAAPAAFVGPVTVDGRPGALYLVDVGPVKVAVALSGCSSSSPAVLASALL